MSEYMLSTTIVTEKQAYAWVAYCKIDKRQREAGVTEAEAIGRLVMSQKTSVTEKPYLGIKVLDLQDFQNSLLAGDMQEHCCTADGSCHTGQHISGKCGPGCSKWEGEEG